MPWFCRNKPDIEHPTPSYSSLCNWPNICENYKDCGDLDLIKCLIYCYTSSSKVINQRLLQSFDNQGIKEPVEIIANCSPSFKYNPEFFACNMLDFFKNTRGLHPKNAITVYHGTNQDWGGIQEGGIYYLKTFVSTSYSIAPAMNFGKTIFKIKIPETSLSNCLFINNNQEEEILLPVGSQLQINEINKINKKVMYFNENITEIECNLLEYTEDSLKKLISHFNKDSKLIKNDNGSSGGTPVGENTEGIEKYEMATGDLVNISNSHDNFIKILLGKENKVGGSLNKLNNPSNKTIRIGNKIFKITCDNKVRLPLSFAQNLHNSLGFNDKQLFFLLGKNRIIYGIKRQYIFITLNEAMQMNSKIQKINLKIYIYKRMNIIRKESLMNDI